MVKNLPAMQETWVHSLGWEDPLEKEIATHYSFLAWRILWTEEPGGVWYLILRVCMPSCFSHVRFFATPW